MTQLEDLVETGIKFANRCLIEDREKELSPMFHVLTPQGEEDMVIVTPWRNNLEKKIAVAQVKSAARKADAQAVMFMTEVWMVVMPKPLTPWHAQRQNLPIPSQSPDRIEAVFILAIDNDDHTASATLQIVRDKPGGKIISLVKDEVLSESKRYESWMFDGMFRPKA